MIETTMPKGAQTAILWSGGKDCGLAMHEAVGAGLDARLLVTFAPPKAAFLAHPLAVIRAQAAAIGIPHRLVEIVEPYDQSYRRAIIALRDEGLGAIVTGDIAEVAGLPNWVTQCSRGTGIDVVMPLWHRDRRELLTRLIDGGFRAIMSCVKTPWFTIDWLGRAIDRPCLGDLTRLAAVNGVDLCGENGEYHSLLLDGPMFHRPLEMKADKATAPDGLMHLAVREVSEGRRR
jgi:diphthine-ammonia ligase